MINSAYKKYSFMKTRYLILLILLLPAAIFANEKSLKILTLNVWSGLNYNGTCKVGEYETELRREQRYRSLLVQLKILEPDIIFLQEVNPAGKYSTGLADALGYNEIHHVCNAGLKILGIGIPSNLNEGLSILTKPGYELEKFDVWKLSGSPGVNGDFVNIHFNEAEYALVGKIKIKGIPFYLINVHLFAAVGRNDELKKKLDSLHEGRIIAHEEYNDALSDWENGLEKQKEETKELIRKKRDIPDSTPIIMAGDFNSTPESDVIKRIVLAGNMIHTYGHTVDYYPNTWDPLLNKNIKFSVDKESKQENNPDPFNRISSDFDKQSKTIDYIFLNELFTPKDIIKTEIAADSSINGTQPSDHFGVLSEINIDDVLKRAHVETDLIKKPTGMTIEPLPILNYDSDAGFGYGAKAFALNMLKMNESFDIVLFNSTKGERWYRFVFSLPDFDLRQFKKYPLSIDLTVDYDKWITSNFFGTGSSASYDDKQTYTKEPLEASLMFGHAFSKSFITQAGIKYKSVKQYNFSNQNELFQRYPELKREKVAYSSLLLNARYDTRNSFTNSSSGSVVQLESEIVPKAKFNDVNFARLSLWLQQYFTLCYPKTVLALRYSVQSIFGNDIPVQNLLSLGGNSTLRGSVQDRYLDKTSSLFNAELRFPIYWRFGGVTGIDAGKVWGSLSKVDLKNWVVNSAFGLRFCMNTFVIRFDVGLGKETTGIYLNFGQLF